MEASPKSSFPPGIYNSSLTAPRAVMSVLSSMRYCLGDPTEFSNIWAALGFIPFGLFFDFMDGKIARWRRKSSLMGQELDSLADLVGWLFSVLLSMGLADFLLFLP